MKVTEKEENVLDVLDELIDEQFEIGKRLAILRAEFAFLDLYVPDVEREEDNAIRLANGLVGLKRNAKIELDKNKGEVDNGII